MARFTILNDGEPERSLTLDTDDLAIGRHPDAEIELPSQTISRFHARIRRLPEGLVLEDLGSVNGFSVLGQRLTRHVLAPGDWVRLEEYTLIYEPPEDIFQAGLAGASAPPEHGDVGMTYLSAHDFAAGAEHPEPDPGPSGTQPETPGDVDPSR